MPFNEFTYGLALGLPIGAFIMLVVLSIASAGKDWNSAHSACTGDCDQGRNCNCQTKGTT